MTTPKRLKRTSSNTFQRPTSGQSTNNNQWNRRLNRSSKAVHDDDIKLTFQSANTPKEDLFFKSAKDSKDINDKYRKLMKEESELLQDLRKLQLKKQLLVKRSKQLKDEQIVKLNIDLQKEKDIRTDLEKKFSNLEKKLNQLEKEIDNRNREKKNDSNDRIKLRSSWLDIEDTKVKSKDDLSIKKKESMENMTKLFGSKRTLEAENISDHVRPKSTLVDLLSGGQLNQSRGQISSNGKETRGVETAGVFGEHVFTKVLSKCSKLDLTPKFIGPLLPTHHSPPKRANTETNTEPIDTEAAVSTPHQPKYTQTIQNNLNNVIRDILVRQHNASPKSQAMSQNAGRENETARQAATDQIELINTSPNAQSTGQQSDESSPDSSSQSPSSVNVNFSPTSSGNLSF